MKINFSDKIKRWFNYLDNQLPDKERFLLEKEMQRDPFLQDAIDGFSGFTIDTIENDLILLQKRIITKNKHRISLSLRWKIAASILIFIGTGSLVWYLSESTIKKHPIAQQTQPADKVNLETTSENSKELALTPEPAEAEELIKHENEKRLLQKTIRKEQKSPIQKTSVQEDSMDQLSGKKDVTLAENRSGQEVQEPVESDFAVTTVTSGIVSSEAKELLPVSTGNLAGLKIIKGKVVDAQTKGELPGVSIQSGSKGIISDSQGDFEFTVSKDDTLIRFAFVGMEELVLKPSDVDSEQVFIELQPSVVALEEVVISENHSKRKKSALSSVSSVRTKNVSETAFQGTLAGVNKTKSPLRFSKFELNYSSNLNQHCLPLGGVKPFENYLSENLTITNQLTEWFIVEFTVTGNGDLQNFQFLPIFDTETSSTLEQLIKNGPEWLPAAKDGSAVDEIVKLEIRF